MLFIARATKCMCALLRKFFKPANRAR